MSGEQVGEAGLTPPGWSARLSVAAFAMLGHAFVVGLALAAVASAGGLFLLLRLISSGAGYLLLLKLGLPLLAFAWCVIRALWVTSPPPDGVPVERTDAPRLWTVIAELERELRTPRVHRVHLSEEFGAAIGRYPRLGLLGWHSNVLFLGMPGLLASAPDQVRAIIAHELAHLSRKHNWTTRLVWRARASAERVQASLAATYQSSKALTARFFDWYRPALERRAMALSRAHEFEADRLAAEVTGPELVGRALLERTICDDLLDRQFWPEVGHRYDRGATCPENIFRELRAFLSTRLDVTVAEGRLKEVLAVRSGPFCSHPSIAERLAALGVEPQVPALRPLVTAADHFLGDRLDHYLELVSDDWRAARADAWEAGATWRQDTEAEIAALEREAANRALDNDELTRLADLRASVHGRDAAARQDLELLERNPEHLRAGWRLGQAGLEAGHAHGLPLVLRVMRRDWRAIPPGTSAIRDAAKSGVIELTAELEEQLDRLAETYDAAAYEFDDTTHFDLLEPHGLDAAAVQRLTDVVQGLPQIRQAYLVRKRLKSVPGISGLVLGIVPAASWTSELLATDFGAQDRLVQEVSDRAGLFEFFLVISLSDQRLLKNRMRRVPSATLISRPWYDLALSTPRYSRRAALAGLAALGLGGVLAWDGTRGWPGSRRAMAWALGTEPAPAPPAPPLVLDRGLFAMAPFFSAVHGGLEAAYRAHAALDAALAAAVACWHGRQEKAAARQRLMAHRDDARQAGQRLAGYLGMIRAWHEAAADVPKPVAAALDALAAHDQEVRNNIANVVVLLSDEVRPEFHGRLVGLHFKMRGHPISRERDLVQATSSILPPNSPERAFLEAIAVTVELQLGLLQLTLKAADAAGDDLADLADELDALMAPPGFAPALQSALAARETLLQHAGELAADSALGLSPADIAALAESYATTGRAAIDAFNVGLHVRADLHMMLQRGDADAAAFLRRAIDANRELNHTLARRSAAAKARLDWMLDLAGSRTV